MLCPRKDAIISGKLPKDPTDKRLFLENVFERTHKRKNHDYPLTIRKLQEFHFNIEVPKPTISDLLDRYVNSAKADILANQKRVLFETKTESIARSPS